MLARRDLGEFLYALDEAFRNTAVRFSSRTAIADEAEETTYRELDEKATALAAMLREEGVSPGSVVALRMAPSARLVAGMLAVLRCGACYLPIDPSGPRERAELILDDAGPVGVLSDDGWAPAQGDVHRVEPGTAYIIHTSGTTGRPKGVPVTNAQVSALFTATSGLFGFTEDDRWVLYHSTAFDFSVWEIWGALLHGGLLYVPGRWRVRDPYEFAAEVRRRRITVLNQTPAAFSALSPYLLKSDEPLDLRYVIFGGERLQPAALGAWADVYGTDRPRLINMYGITETTVHATFHRISAADLAGNDSVIGSVLPGFVAQVLDEKGRPADRGELLLAGPQVGAGYLGAPELTAERFVLREGRTYYRSGDLVSRRPDGALTYLGRADRQVKIRGHRIELGEVEAAFTAEPEISGCAALPVSVAGMDALACFYTTHDGTPLGAGALRGRLRNRIPDYMMPTRLRWIPEIPQNHNGKVDRQKIAEMMRGSGDRQED